MDRCSNETAQQCGPFSHQLAFSLLLLHFVSLVHPSGLSTFSTELSPNSLLACFIAAHALVMRISITRRYFLFPSHQQHCHRRFPDIPRPVFFPLHFQWRVSGRHLLKQAENFLTKYTPLWYAQLRTSFLYKQLTFDLFPFYLFLALCFVPFAMGIIEVLLIALLAGHLFISFSRGWPLPSSLLRCFNGLLCHDDEKQEAGGLGSLAG